MHPKTLQTMLPFLSTSLPLRLYNAAHFLNETLVPLVELGTVLQIDLEMSDQQ